eukprot:COSAG05_NODE_6541_length_940_cov_1.788347_1_plen_33_part_01
MSWKPTSSVGVLRVPVVDDGAPVVTLVVPRKGV